VIPTSPRSSKMESGCSTNGRFGFSCFCLFQGQRLRPRRAGDSGPKCVLAVFVRSFGQEPPGTFARPETPALESGDSGRRDFWSGARLCIGPGVFLAHGQRLGAEDSGPQGQRLWGKCPATAIFCGRPIKGPLLPPWDGGFHFSLSCIVGPSSFGLSPSPSHDSC
jgi:hypothetical protein